MDLAGFGFGFGFGFDLDLAWILVQYSSQSSHGSPRRSQEAPSGNRRSSLGKVSKATKATEVIKCLIEYEIDHLAS